MNAIAEADCEKGFFTDSSGSSSTLLEPAILAGPWPNPTSCRSCRGVLPRRFIAFVLIPELGATRTPIQGLRSELELGRASLRSLSSGLRDQHECDKPTPHDAVESGDRMSHLVGGHGGLSATSRCPAILIQRRGAPLRSVKNLKKALLVIELQNDYFPGGKFPLWNTDATITGRCPAPVDGVHRFKLRQSSSIGPLPVSASPISGIMGRNGCQARGPYSNASRTPVHAAGFTGG